MAANGPGHPVLEGFSPAVREWFAASFPEPTQPQIEGWPAIRAGQHTLVCAPTGSGKTLTAFLSSIDRLVTPDQPGVPTQVLYISPLRALAFDVEKNLRSPLMGRPPRRPCSSRPRRTHRPRRGTPSPRP